MHFNGVRAVDDITFTVPEGEVFGFIGPNGAGKTTTIRILATLLVPTAGRAWVDGHCVVNEPEAVRQVLGYMPAVRFSEGLERTVAWYRKWKERQ